MRTTARATRAAFLVATIWGCDRPRDEIAHVTNSGDFCSGVSVGGVVYDPAGKNPLYDVLVFVPGGPLDPLPSGVTCGVPEPSAPMASTSTDSAGRFSLCVQPGDDVPLVIQLGKWRKTIVIPHVAVGGDTQLTDPSVMRLPANQSEGDMPQIALVTGGCDPLQCLLRRIGIDDREFTAPDQAGRVHVFTGAGGAYVAGSMAAPLLYSQLPVLMQHDVTLLAAECASPDPGSNPQTSLQNMFDYANAGGRIFMWNYHSYWLENGPAPFPAVATWQHVSVGLTSIVGSVDNSFPEGQAFEDWLVTVGASPTAGKLTINHASGDVKSANLPSQQWITYAGAELPPVQHFSFDTPYGQTQDKLCGRVEYSDIDVASGESAAGPFPHLCYVPGWPMSAQEQALEFLLFDLWARPGHRSTGH